MSNSFKALIDLLEIAGKHVDYMADNPDLFTKKEVALVDRAVKQHFGDVGGDMEFLWRWVERGFFDPKTSANQAISLMAHYPGAPWGQPNWNTSHLPYHDKVMEMADD